jgi:hypothetical protein
MKTIDLVKQYLQDEGYKYEIDQDGDVHFKYQGVNLFYTDSGNDSLFFRIIMPSIYTVENNRTKVLEACNTVTRDIKVLKAFLVGDNLWLDIEMFIDSTPEFNDFFPRCLDILYEGRKRVAAEIFND